MQTNRTLSRSTLTVQDMTVVEAMKPNLPSIATPRCGLRPSPGTATRGSQRREERGFPALGTSLAVSRNLVKAIVSWLSRLSLNIHQLSTQSLSIPTHHAPKGRAIHPPLGKTGAFWPVSVREDTMDGEQDA